MGRRPRLSCAPFAVPHTPSAGRRERIGRGDEEPGMALEEAALQDARAHEAPRRLAEQPRQPTRRPAGTSAAATAP